MTDSNNQALEPFGHALLAYWRGNKSAELMHEFKNGQKKPLPVSVFFRSHEEFLTTDNAIEYCRGKILVVGAGTGVHALELEKQGYKVTAIDICPQAVQIMKERGIMDARQQDFLHFDSERFDTIFMLGHNIGICETLKGIRGLLHRCERLLQPGGQLLVNSVKELETINSPNPKGYPGELEFRLSYERNVGPWMRWLHVDFKTLTSHALKCGWSAVKLIETENGGFLARMNPNS
jgi:2-polyprenyl-3-methyl-5-hydroxy-6-metoxy-1,4-benzoquinol methylase